MIEAATSQIRTRPDGSIDTAHYMARGRVARARQFRHLAGELLRAPAARKPRDRSGLLRRLLAGTGWMAT